MDGAKRLMAATFILLFSANQLQAQKVRYSGFEPQQGYLIGVHYGGYQPFVDLADRFSAFSSLSINTLYKTKKNWHFGLDYQWQFGDNVKENNILDPLKNSDGQIIDANGQYSVVQFQQRGNMITANISKVFPLTEKNRNSGLFVEAGTGLYWHKIYILASRTTIPQLNEEYIKGYDRLSGGLILREWVGYQFLDPAKRINFRAGIELGQAFTSSWRSWDTDQMKFNDQRRRDVFGGIRVGLILPVYTKAADDEFFFED